MDKTTTWLVRGAAAVVILTPVAIPIAIYGNTCTMGISIKTNTCNQTRIQRSFWFAKKGRPIAAIASWTEPKYEGEAPHFDFD